MSTGKPSARTIGLGVVLVVIIAAVVLEAWTFFDLIQFQIDEEETNGPSENQVQTERAGTDDSVQLAEDLAVSIRRMQVDVTDDGWRFELHAVIRNQGTEPIRFRSGQIGLSSGSAISLDGRQTIQANNSDSVSFRIRIPEGTEARSWTVSFRRGKTKKEQTRTVHLKKAPVRRRK